MQSDESDHIETWIRDLKESELIDLWDDLHAKEDLLEVYESSRHLVVESAEQTTTNASSDNPPF